MLPKRILTFLILLTCGAGLFPRETDYEGPVRLGELNFHIARSRDWLAGVTREPALRKYYGMRVGDTYVSPEELESWLEEVTRGLNSRQVFKDISYDIRYWYEENLNQEKILTAHVDISVQDSFSLYLLPFALYDSNLGVLYGGRFAYDNAFGRLTDISLRGYTGETTWRAGGTWENVPLGPIEGNFSLFCNQNRTIRVDDYDNRVLEYTNLRLDFYMAVQVPLIGNWSLSFMPGAYLPFSRNLVYSDPAYGREEFDSLDPVTNGFMEWGILYDSVYWEENFRRGVSGGLRLRTEGPVGEADLSNALDAVMSGFYRPLPYLGLAHHLSFFYIFNGVRNDAARHIRGVLDHLMYGEWGIFLNNNIDVRAFTIPPFLEMHVYPLLDGGFVYNSTTPFEPYDMRLAAGFGITLFPLFLQSLRLNMEVGYDLIKKGESEITIKSELFF
jgi:hypothetical protein